MTEADFQCSSHGTRTHPAPNPEDCRECKLLRLLDEARGERDQAERNADHWAERSRSVFALLREPGEDVLAIVTETYLRSLVQRKQLEGVPVGSEGVRYEDMRAAIAALCRHAEELAERDAANTAGDVG